MNKGAQFETIKRDTVYTEVLSNSITRGEHPEHENATLTFDNADGQLEAFVGRTDVPLVLYDADTGIVLFEGTAEKISGSDAVQNPRSISMECRGMAFALMQAEFTNFAPDFGHDPAQLDGSGDYWSSPVHYCFNMAGFEDERVIIEDVAKYNFRLWDATGAGGAQANPSASSGEGKSSGDGHVKADGSPGARWKPKEDSKPYEFLTYLLHGFLHWTFHYNYTDRCWHVFRRPFPQEKTDADKFTPKAAFFGDTTRARVFAAANPGFPVYVHRNATFDSKRPECSSVLVKAVLTEGQVLSKAELYATMGQAVLRNGLSQNALDAFNASQASAEGTHWVSCGLQNPLCYPCDANTKGYKNNPDWLGTKRVRVLPISAPDRNSLQWAAYRIYWEHCFGRNFYKFNADFGDAITTYFRKWDCVLIDTGHDKDGNKDFSLELWHYVDGQAQWTHDTNRQSGYRWVKARIDIPPPF